MKNSEPTLNQTSSIPTSQPENIPTSTLTPPQPLTSKTKKPYLLISLIVFLLGATGTFAYKYYQVKQQLDNQQPALLPSPKPVVSPTSEVDPMAEMAKKKAEEPITEIPANWTTYKNLEYGYQISFPSNWQAKNVAAGGGGEALENSIMVELSDPNIIKYSKETGSNNGFIFLTHLQLSTRKATDKNVNQLTINNIPSLVEQHQNGNKTYVFTLLEGESSIEALVNYSINNPESNKLFDQILSTFQFTN